MTDGIMDSVYKRICPSPRNSRIPLLAFKKMQFKPILKMLSTTEITTFTNRVDWNRYLDFRAPYILRSIQHLIPSTMGPSRFSLTTKVTGRAHVTFQFKTE